MLQILSAQCCQVWNSHGRSGAAALQGPDVPRSQAVSLSICQLVMEWSGRQQDAAGCWALSRAQDRWKAHQGKDQMSQGARLTWAVLISSDSMKRVMT